MEVKIVILQWKTLKLITPEDAEMLSRLDIELMAIPMFYILLS
jgi:hypothetical protein